MFAFSRNLTSKNYKLHHGNKHRLRLTKKKIKKIKSIKYTFLRYSSLNKNFFISASGHLGSYRYFNKLNADQKLISSSRATGLLYSKHTKFAQHTEQNGKEGELIVFFSQLQI